MTRRRGALRAVQPGNPGPEPAEPEGAEPIEPAAAASAAKAQSLAEEEARHRALFAALRSPIITASLDGRVSGFNAAAVALFGSPARLYGRPVTEVLPFVSDSRSGASGEGGEATWQGRLADATGRTVDLEVSLTLLKEGETRSWAVYVVHDISRHAEVNRLREQLLYSVAHELRGPLMVLDNALEILESEYARLTAAEFDQVLGSARRTSRRLRTLMEDLLSAGSIQSGHFVVAPRKTHLRVIVTDALEIVSPSIDGRGQHVEIDLASAGPLVMADKRYARQVLSNLIANASKYSPEQSTIRVVAERLGSMVRISVEDQGSGIPPEQQAGLFERFYRVRSDSSVTGVGLGLAIAKGIVEAHGGSIGIESAPGSGTRVWFTLPGEPRAAPNVGKNDAHPAG